MSAFCRQNKLNIPFDTISIILKFIFNDQTVWMLTSCKNILMHKKLAHLNDHKYVFIRKLAILIKKVK